MAWSRLAASQCPANLLPTRRRQRQRPPLTQHQRLVGPPLHLQDYLAAHSFLLVAFSPRSCSPSVRARYVALARMKHLGASLMRQQVPLGTGRWRSGTQRGMNTRRRTALQSQTLHQDGDAEMRQPDEESAPATAKQSGSKRGACVRTPIQQKRRKAAARGRLAAMQG